MSESGTVWITSSTTKLIERVEISINGIPISKQIPYRGGGWVEEDDLEFYKEHAATIIQDWWRGMHTRRLK